MGSGGGKPIGRIPDSILEATLVSNLNALVRVTPTTRGGYFGEPSDGGSRHTRTLRSDDPRGSAEKFFERARRGGEMSTKRAGEVEIASFGGARVRFRRDRSSDGSPVIEIEFGERVSGFPGYQKIRFERTRP